MVPRRELELFERDLPLGACVRHASAIVAVAGGTGKSRALERALLGGSRIAP
jgi:hypothetical protein